MHRLIQGDLSLFYVNWQFIFFGCISGSLIVEGHNYFIMLNRLSLSCFRYFSSVKAYNPAKNYYKVLNLTESATQKDIKRSFRELAKKYHPDSTKGKQDAFKEVNEAYQVLSDESIKRSYDQERRLSDSSRQSHTANNYSQANTQRQSSQQSQAHNNYRGYQREQGWQNRNFREQFMYDLHRAQQNDFQRNYSQSERQRFQQQFRDNIRRATQGPNQSIRQYTEAAKRKQAQMRKQYEQQQRRREQMEREYFRHYRDDTTHDLNDKMKQKFNKIADDIAGNIKQVLSVTDQLKSIWNNIKKKK